MRREQAGRRGSAGDGWAHAFEPMEARLLLSNVVINEIHYDPDVKTEPAEFVELYNATNEDIDISHWTFSDGIAFEFPATTMLPQHGYVVVAQDPATILAKYGVTALGPYVGQLANDGERIVLRDQTGAVVDEVDYGAGFPWPTVGDAPGYSIELINPTLDNDLGGSWRASAGSAVTPQTLIPDGAVWTYFKGTAEPSPSDEWRQIGFAETGWLTGTLALGYSDEQEELNFIETQLTDMQGGYSTVYLRKTFEVGDPNAISSLELLTQYDDGINVWINGTHVLGLNVDGDELPHDGTARDGIDNVEFITNVLAGAGDYLLSGTNVIAVQLLNSSLSGSSDAFFDALLRTSTGGSPGVTPGAPNSVYAANAPPQMRQVDHSPNQPASGEEVVVTMKVTDPDGVQGVTLGYQVVEPGDYINLGDTRYNDPAYWTTVAMRDDGTGGDAAAADGVYTVTLPGSVQVHRRLIRYRVTATDMLGASVTGPYADDPQPNFAYFVYDGVPSWTGSVQPGTQPEVEYSGALLESLPVYTLLTKRQDHLDAMHVPYRWGKTGQQLPSGGGYGGLDYLWQGTLVYDGVVYDHVRFRARGGVWRYAMGKNMWKFDFNRNHSFQARDDYGQEYGTTWDKLNLGACIQQGDYLHRGEQGLFESVGFKLFNLTGVESSYTNFVQFRIIEGADENGPDQFSGDFQGLYLVIEQPDGRMLDEHDMADGNLYKMEGGTGELNNQGPTQPTNKSDLNAFMNAYNSGPTDQWWRDNFELDSYYSYRAIVECIHHYDIGYGKNYFYYHDPETGTWSVHPWDLDLTWANNMYGNGEEPFKSRVLSRAAFSLEYRNRMREIRDLLYNPEQTGILIDEMAALIYTPGQLSFVDADRAMWDYNPILVSSYVNSSKAGYGRFYQQATTKNFPGMIQLMKNYIVSRGSWIDSTILTDETMIPSRPTVTYTGLAGYPGDALTFQCSAYSSAVSPFGAMEWRIAEVSIPTAPEFDPSDPRAYEIEADWESGELAWFDPNVAVPRDVVEEGHRYRVRVRMCDSSGRYSHWSNPVEFVAGARLGSSVPLRITEIMYNPPPADTTPGNPEAPYGDNNAFEYVELRNIHATNTIHLAGIQFTEGVHFAFPDMDLGPGEYVLVVKNQAAFNARYDPLGTIGYRIAGEFLDDTSLGNGGDHLILKDTLDFTIHDFDYSENWFSHVDVEGFSLVVRDALQDSDLWDSKDGWRASWTVGGNPGAADTGYNPGSIVINEVVAHSNFAPQDWIELRNTTGAAINITGWFLSDDAADLTKYQIGQAAPVVIPAYGYAVFTELENFGQVAADPGKNVWFALSELGDQVYLTSSPDAAALGGYREDEDFGASDPDTSFGRYEKPSGGKDFVAVVSQTFEGANAAPVIPDVVINEIMYSPMAGGDEYIELYNGTATDFPLYDDEVPANPWRFTDGVTFAFPAGAYVPASGYALVVKIDPAAFRAKYVIPASVNIYGPYTGSLADEGERVELSRPGNPEQGGLVPYVQAEKVGYDSAPPWPTTPRGVGPSLERIDPQGYGNDVSNWRASSLVGGTPGWENGGPPPDVTVNVSASDAAAAEAGRDPGTFTVSRTGLTTGSLTVYYSLTGTAATTDYGPLLPGWVVLGIGQSSVTITITPVDDTQAETAETVILTLGAHPTYTLGMPSATVTIADNDQPPDVTVSIQASDALAGEQGPDPGQFTISRTGNTANLLTVHYTRSGTASAGDYTPTLSGQINMPAGVASVTLDVTPVDDVDDEPDETLILSLAADSDYLIGVGSATVVIVDNDGGPGVVVGIQVSDATAAEEGRNPGTFSITRTGSIAAALTVYYTVSGTASPSDYVPLLPGQITMASGVTLVTIIVTPVDDLETEPDETVILTLTPRETYDISSPTASLTIADNDADPPTATVGLMAVDASASETGPDMGIFVFIRVGETTNDLTVYYTVGGTAAASDYTPVLTGQCVIPAGQAWAYLVITPVDDAQQETSESVLLTLVNGPGYMRGTSIALVTIADNDDPSIVRATVAATDPNAAELGTDAGQFTVTRTGDLVGALTVYYTLGGTAGAGDYAPTLTGQVVIADGAPSAVITITPVDDGDQEPNETLVLTLSANASYTLGAATQATVTILDNDQVVTIAATDPNAAEQGTDPGEFTVTRTGDLVGALTVYYTLGGTAGAGDYTPTLTGQVVIPDASDSAVITITPVDDGDQEPDETLVLTLTPHASYTVAAGDEATVTILDNELPVVTAVVLNPNPLRTVRTVSQIEPSGIGVDTIRVTFSEAVTFTSANVVAEKVFVDESGNVSVTATLTPTVGGSGTTQMSIQFPSAWQNVIDTWVRIRLTGGVTDGDGHALDGEPRLDSSNLGYIYKATDDLPTGDGTAGGDAVFYVGSLRADMRGFGPFQPNPNGIVDQWDLNGFTSKYTQGNLDADFRGFGPFQPAPNGIVDPWDINGFTSAYTSALTLGKRLWPLPVAPEGMAPGGVLGSGELLSAPLASGDPVAVFAPETSLVAADAAAPLESAPALVSADSQSPAADAESDAADGAYAGVLTVASDEASEPAPAVWSPTASEPSSAGEAVDLLAGPALEVVLSA